MRGVAWCGAFALLLLGCEEKAAPPLSSLKPPPLPSVEAVRAKDAPTDPREAAHQVAFAEVFGEPVPDEVPTIVLKGEETSAAFGDAVLLTFDDETYLAQAAVSFAALSDSGAEVWFKHPRKDVAYRVRLMDEPGFAQWLAEPVPGKLRIVQRADGLELTTNMGKLPGPDANGPSIPVRGGKLDIATLRASLEKLKQRFGARASDVCLLPSFGTELSKIADVMSGTFRTDGEPIYEELCLVFPRPSPKPAK